MVGQERRGSERNNGEDAREGKRKEEKRTYH
jgi:hypothetical protein